MVESVISSTLFVKYILITTCANRK